MSPKGGPRAGAGRPREGPEKTQLTIRLSQDLREAMQDQADSEGLPVSAWLLSLAEQALDWPQS